MTAATTVLSLAMIGLGTAMIAITLARDRKSVV